MDSSTEARIETALGGIDHHAIYLLIDSPGGVLIENLAPLLTALEDIYRRLMILRLDGNLLQMLVKRQASEERLSGIGRSINTKYSRITLEPNEQLQFSIEDLALVAPRKYGSTPGGFGKDDNQIVLAEQRDVFIPTRVQMGRTKISSPGFIELLGDPSTLQGLIALLGALLIVRGQNQSRLIAAHQLQSANIGSLESLGYSRDEIKAVTKYLDTDLKQLIEQLEKARAQIAPGNDIDPTKPPGMK